MYTYVYIYTYIYKHDNLWSLQMSDGWCMCADEPPQQAQSAHNHAYSKKIYIFPVHGFSFDFIFGFSVLVFHSSHLPCCSWPVVVYVT